MDTTLIDDLLIQLQAADSADAPDLADDLAAALAESLDPAEEGQKIEPPVAAEADPP